MKAGQRFIVTTGEYSDYGIRDSFAVLKTFSFDATLRRWLNKCGDNGEFSFSAGQTEQDFLASLRTDGLVGDEPLNEVHLCDYSRPGTSPANDDADDAESVG